MVFTASVFSIQRQLINGLIQQPNVPSFPAGGQNPGLRHSSVSDHEVKGIGRKRNISCCRVPAYQPWRKGWWKSVLARHHSHPLLRLIASIGLSMYRSEKE
jgi:hypothetical protein